jgi:hypothetical protein
MIRKEVAKADRMVVAYDHVGKSNGFSSILVCCKAREECAAVACSREQQAAM